MSRRPLYIELLTHLNTYQQGDEWVDLADPYRQKLENTQFYTSFKEEIDFLVDNGDILIKGNLQENPAPEALNLSGRITEGGEEYLYSYKFAQEENKDKYSNRQIALLMLSIVVATGLLAVGLAYFFG